MRTSAAGCLPRSRLGFSLIELLLVVGIIALLIGLLLPAVQNVRDAALVVKCSGQLQQLSLACMNHENGQGYYPHGGWGFRCVGLPAKGFGPNQPGGWIYSILPYIDNSVLFQEADPNVVVKTPLAVLICPSRRRVQAFTPGPSQWLPYLTPSIPAVARSDYALNGGSSTAFDTPGPSDSNNPPAAFFTDGVAARAGTVNASVIADGVGNTYMLGEKYINPDHYYDGKDYGDNENCYVGSDRDVWRTGTQPARDRPGLDLSYSFGSAHANSFIMAFCDGHIKRVAYTINTTVHRKLTICNDGQTAQPD